MLKIDCSLLCKSSGATAVQSLHGTFGAVFLEHIQGAAYVLQTAHGISRVVELLQPCETLALHHDHFTADWVFHDFFVEALYLIATRVSHSWWSNLQLGIPPPALLMPGHVYVSVWRRI